MPGRAFQSALTLTVATYLPPRAPLRTTGTGTFTWLSIDSTLLLLLSMLTPPTAEVQAASTVKKPVLSSTRKSSKLLAVPCEHHRPTCPAGTVVSVLAAKPARTLAAMVNDTPLVI